MNHTLGLFGPNRRLWLLLKAFEKKPLGEALLLAQVADRFLTRSSSDPPLGPLLPITWISTGIH
jgi:hypothetical protein